MESGLINELVSCHIFVVMHIKELQIAHTSLVKVGLSFCLLADFGSILPEGRPSANYLSEVIN